VLQCSSVVCYSDFTVAVLLENTVMAIYKHCSIMFNKWQIIIIRINITQSKIVTVYIKWL